MKQLTHLKPTELLAIEAPEDIDDWSFSKIKNYLMVFCNVVCADDSEFKKRGTYEIVGTVDKDNISFYVEPYVNKIELEDSPDNGIINGYWDYTIHKRNELIDSTYAYNTPQESFYSLLAANGLLFDWRDLTQQSYQAAINDTAKFKNNENLIKRKLLILKRI